MNIFKVQCKIQFIWNNMNKAFRNEVGLSRINATSAGAMFQMNIHGLKAQG